MIPKNALILFTLLSMWSSNAQNSVSPKKIIDAGTIVFPGKNSFQEFYSLGFQLQVRETNINISGLFFSQLIVDKSFVNSSKQESQIGFGISTNVFKDKKIYFEPAAHLIYNHLLIQFNNISYRGVGIQCALRTGIRIKEFGIGALILTSYSYGKRSPGIDQISGSSNAFNWLELAGGINVKYYL